MEKVIKIGGKLVKLKATAATPHKYRAMFHRDILSDMSQLINSFSSAKNDGVNLSFADLEIFENIAFVMAKQGGSNAADIDEWLDGFEIFDIYTVLPQILEMWNLETKTLTESKKNLQKAAEN